MLIIVIGSSNTQSDTPYIEWLVQLEIKPELTTQQYLIHSFFSLINGHNEVFISGIIYDNIYWEKQNI